MSCNQTANVTIGTTYTATVTQGGKPYQWGTLVVSPASTTIQDDALINKTIGAIIYINNVPLDWQLAGVTFDSETGTFDTTAYQAIGGTIRYEYK